MASTNLDHHNLDTDSQGGPMVREEVMGRIWLHDMFERPFTDLCASDRSGNRYFEWVTDVLGAPNLTNRKVDGQDFTGNEASVGEREGNYCQIIGREVQVSTRADVSRSIGRQGSVSYQIMRAQQRLRRDQEAILLSDQASVQDDGNTTPGQLGGFFAWLKTNTIHGTTGSAGGFNPATKIVDAPTKGTAGAITEVNVKDVLQGVYEAGGNTDCIIGRPVMIRKLSEYYMQTSNAATQTNQRMGEERDRSLAAYTSVTVIISDFGHIVKLVPNRLQAQRDLDAPDAGVSHLAFVDPKGIRVAYLRGFVTEALAKKGLSRHMMVTADFTLGVTDERIQGGIFDVLESEPITAS